MYISKQQFNEAYAKIPFVIREYIIGDELGEVVQSVGQKFGLHVDTIGAVDREVTNMLLGLESPAQFTGELKSVGVPEGNIGVIVQELNTRIFIPLHQRMQNGGGEDPHAEDEQILKETLQGITIANTSTPSLVQATYTPPASSIIPPTLPIPAPVLASVPAYVPPAPPLPVPPPAPTPIPVPVPVIPTPSVSQLTTAAPTFPAYIHKAPATIPGPPQTDPVAIPTPRPLPPEVEAAIHAQAAPAVPPAPATTEISAPTPAPAPVPTPSTTFTPLEMQMPSMTSTPTAPEHPPVRTMASDMAAMQSGKHPAPFQSAPAAPVMQQSPAPSVTSMPHVASTAPTTPALAVQQQPHSQPAAAAPTANQFIATAPKPSEVPTHELPKTREVNEREALQSGLQQYGIDPYREPV